MNNLVDFEVAQKLKSLGFNNVVNKFYYKSQDHLDCGDGDIEWINLDHNQWEDFYSAPTIEEMFEWLHSTNDENVDEFIKFLLERK